MLLGGLLALAFGVTPALATDVAVPEATPGSPGDFAVSYMVYDMLASELRDRDIVVADGDDLRATAGALADACFANPSCPQDLWPVTDARFAVVLSVRSDPGGLVVEARVYARDRAAALRTLKESVPEGTEAEFAQKLAEIVAELVRAEATPASGGDDEPVDAAPAVKTTTTKATPTKVTTTKPAPAKPEPAKPAATKSTTTKPAATKAEPTKVTTTKTEPAKPASTKTEPAKPASTKTEPAKSTSELTDKQSAERREMGIPEGAYLRYAGSGQKRADWLGEQRVRVGHVHFELEGGLATGDVDRGYGVWVHLVNVGGAASIDGASTWLGDQTGLGSYGGLALGYTPFWFLDLGVGGGVQLGQKHLEDGWECPDCEADTQVVQTVYDPVMGVALLVEPRVRFWLLPTGVVKPFVQVGAQVRLYDGFTDPHADVDFPAASGGVGIGVVGTAGAAFDVTRHFSVQLQAPYTLTLSPQATSTDSELIANDPAQPDSWGGTLRVLVGLGLVY